MMGTKMVGTKEIYVNIRREIFDALDPNIVADVPREQLASQLGSAVNMLVDREKLPLSGSVRKEFVDYLTDELIGLGPLQNLMDDESITDIMVNGPDSVFIERNGLVEKAPISFIDENQLREIAKRIASRIGRRVNESSPTCDARLVDGSRVNIVIPPIAIDGTSISIRKFKKQSIDLNKRKLAVNPI